MKCINKIQIYNSNSGLSHLVNCGQCICCRLNRASEWAMRIMHETRYHDSSVFCTLTYSDEKLRSKSLQKDDYQKFLKRLRKNTQKKIRFFGCGEYGEHYLRPHFHMIIFSLSRDDRDIIEKSWGQGYVHVGDVTYDSANYVAKYVVKKLTGDAKKFYDVNEIIPEFSVMSRRPGIGYSYMQEYSDFLIEKKYVMNRSSKLSVPRYYKKKLYDTNEKKIANMLSTNVSRRNIEKILTKRSNYASNSTTKTWEEFSREVDIQIERDILASQNQKKGVL